MHTYQVKDNISSKHSPAGMEATTQAEYPLCTAMFIIYTRKCCAFLSPCYFNIMICLSWFKVQGFDSY